ncbi:MAG TPA: hypothetical protein VE972_00410 [Conexibacter sp.]|nr:hypothetical protein [Conexibacter sp.]
MHAETPRQAGPSLRDKWRWKIAAETPANVPLSDADFAAPRELVCEELAGSYRSGKGKFSGMAGRVVEYGLWVDSGK